MSVATTHYTCVCLCKMLFSITIKLITAETIGTMQVNICYSQCLTQENGKVVIVEKVLIKVYPEIFEKGKALLVAIFDAKVFNLVILFYNVVIGQANVADA